MLRRVPSVGSRLSGLTALVLTGLVIVVAAVGDDEVTWIDAQGNIESRRGEVVGYNIDELRLRFPQGTERRIAADRILKVDGNRLVEHQRGDDEFDRHDFAAALGQYRAAYGKEKRGWVKQWIAARSIRCLQNLGQFGNAANTFVALYSQDPKTPFVDAIPLAWRAERPDLRLQSVSVGWLDGSAPAVSRLIAASWQLSGSRHGQAISVLRDLSRSHSANWIGQLALAQTWRTRIVNSDLDEIRKWQTSVKEMPFALQAGPQFLLGHALSRHPNRDAAVLAYLQVGLMSPGDWDLAAESLWSAALILREAGRQEEAERLFRELTDRFAEHSLAEQAQRELDSTDAAP